MKNNTKEDENISPLLLSVTPWPLNSLKDICKAFGRSRHTVMLWLQKNAPIIIEGSGTRTRYTSEYNNLLAWLFVKSKEEEKLKKEKRKKAKS